MRQESLPALNTWSELYATLVPLTSTTSVAARYWHYYQYLWASSDILRHSFVASVVEQDEAGVDSVPVLLHSRC